MSSPLFRLPNEVIDQLFHLVLPHEVLALALSYKLIWLLAKPRLQASKELAQSHGEAFLGYTIEVVDGVLLDSPLGFLRSIVKRPELAYYPRSLRLVEYNLERYSDDELSDDRIGERYVC
jgi:hypothetical protein